MSEVSLVGATREQMCEQAARRTGLDDFGDSDFHAGLDLLLADLKEAGLSAQGMVAARENVLGHLAGRLRSVEGFKQHPEAMKRPIVRPLIVCGIVRSGTTALHKLLSMDPQFQGVERWLCSAPQPRPPRAEWAANPDFQQAKASLDAMLAQAPEMLEDHGMAVDTVEESLDLLAQSFRSNMFCSQFVIPNYDRWYRAQDDTPSYLRLADNLRLVGAHDPHRTWLLKNPTDTFSLQEVLNVFPDAMIVQTHRDPLQAIPSVVNLIGSAHRIFRGEQADIQGVFAREEEFWQQAMSRADAVKDAHPGRVLDVQFNDFVKDQIGFVRKIYDQFGLVLSEEAETAMLGWLAANPRRSSTMQRFTPEDYGHSSDALKERYSTYRARYGY
ncbi:sulfotransferase [Novosphingobium taihuense]|uniref:Sulfotransferase family protein n=1 Tax=Novosphingobium taihuense TaxID=260085 RepID=A0A7W7EX66_9SPHN|nr:hypothetical protein [Novosphingobium taihuense]